MLRTCLTVAALLCGTLPSHAETWRVFTSSSLAPFAGGTEEAPAGFHYDLLSLLADRAGLTLELIYMPWERAQHDVKTGADGYLMAPTRNAAREDLYDWIVPVLDVDRVFLTTETALDGYDAASGAGTVAARGTYLRDLESRGFENAMNVETENAMRMLASDRVSAVFTLRERAVIIWRELGFPADNLISGQAVKSTTLWLAGPKGSDPDLALRVRDAMDDIRADGSYDDLHDRYFGTVRSARVGQE